MKDFNGMLDCKRDPHLPDPAICDWLLQQEWSENVKCVDIRFSEGEITRSRLFNFLRATIAIEADYTIEVFMPAGLLPLLRNDSEKREAVQLAAWTEYLTIRYAQAVEEAEK